MAQIIAPQKAKLGPDNNTTTYIYAFRPVSRLHFRHFLERRQLFPLGDLDIHLPKRECSGLGTVRFFVFFLGLLRRAGSFFMLVCSIACQQRGHTRPEWAYPVWWGGGGILPEIPPPDPGSAYSTLSTFNIFVRRRMNRVNANRAFYSGIAQGWKLRIWMSRVNANRAFYSGITQDWKLGSWMTRVIANRAFYSGRMQSTRITTWEWWKKKVNANRALYSDKMLSIHHLQHLGSSPHTVARHPQRYSPVGIHTCLRPIFDMDQYKLNQRSWSQGLQYRRPASHSYWQGHAQDVQFHTCIRDHPQCRVHGPHGFCGDASRTAA